MDVLDDLPERPDVVHCHGPAGAPLLLRRRRRFPPVVLTLHTLRRYQYAVAREAAQAARDGGVWAAGAQLPTDGWRPKVARELALERYLCRHADHLALVAGYMAPLLERYYGIAASRCTVIHNGSEFAATAEPREEEAAAAEPLLLYVGRLDWVKRVHLLIQALPQVLAVEPRARLLIVGDGELRRALEQLAEELALGEHVQFRGWVDHGALSAIYRGARCLCLPSIWEGLPKVVLEAMSVGLPVVTSDIPAHAEVLEQGRLGTLVAQATPAAWAAAMLEVLEHREAAVARAQRSMSVVDERYRWSHVASRVDEAYREVIGR